VKASLLILMLLWSGAAQAATGGSRSCTGSKFPPYPPAGAPINVLTWKEGEPLGGFSTSDCGISSSWGSTLLVGIAGNFHFKGKASDLLARFGAVSSLRGVQYWSVTDHRWQVLITDSSAVSSMNGEQGRADFSVAEMQSGQDLYFEQQDNRSSGRVIYRMKLRERADQGFVLTIDNVTGVWLFLFRLFGPGDLQSLYVLERLGPEEWGYYSLTGVREGILSGKGDRASYVNRALSIYQHITRQPVDQNTPFWR
jgi:hypothetical protein